MVKAIGRNVVEAIRRKFDMWDITMIVMFILLVFMGLRILQLERRYVALAETCGKAVVPVVYEESAETLARSEPLSRSAR